MPVRSTVTDERLWGRKGEMSVVPSTSAEAAAVKIEDHGEGKNSIKAHGRKREESAWQFELKLKGNSMIRRNGTDAITCSATDYGTESTS